MPRLKDVIPETREVWLVNPSGAVVCVNWNNQGHQKAKNKEAGWRSASEEEIEREKARMEKRGALTIEAQEKALDMRARLNARVTPNVKIPDVDAVLDAEPPKRGPGRPRKVQNEEEGE